MAPSTAPAAYWSWRPHVYNGGYTEYIERTGQDSGFASLNFDTPRRKEVQLAVWKRLKDENLGILWSISESLAILDWSTPDLLRPTTHGLMIVASDYSGQHKNASHEAYSFLATTDVMLQRWISNREEFRRQWLPDGRRLSFKNLREPMRWRALNPFLELAGSIDGNLITFLIDQRLKNFSAGGARELAGLFPDCFEGVPDGTIEKMFRLASLLAFITSGFRREDQRSVWISDHDETLATFLRREQFATLASYLTFGCARWSEPADMIFGTTESPLAPPWAEDLASLPDLVAGTYCGLSGVLPASQGVERWVRTLSANAVQDKRLRAVGDWLAGSIGCLRHVLLRVDVEDNCSIRTSAQCFNGFSPSSI